VTIKYEVVYGLSIATKIHDLEHQFTALLFVSVMRIVTKRIRVFRCKVALYHNYPDIKFDDEVQR